MSYHDAMLDRSVAAWPTPHWPLLLSATAAFILATACGSDGIDGGGTTQSGQGGAAGGAVSATSTSSASSGGGGAVSSGGWETLTPIGLGARQENAVTALDGEVFVIGGFNDQTQVVGEVEAYDPVSDSWRNVTSLPQPRHHVNAATVAGKIYALGGLGGSNFAASPTSWVYDPADGFWTPVAPMPAGTERGGGGVAVVGSKIYIAGGFRGGSVTDMSAYDTSDDSWEVLAALPQPSDHLVAGAVDGIVYAIGGRNGGIDGVVDTVRAYDPTQDSWQSVAPMPTARGGCAAATLNGLIYVFGGEGNQNVPGGVFDNVSAYDAARDSWTVLDPMQTPRHGTGAATVGGVIYVPGGATKQAFGAVDTHEAYVP